MAGTLFKKLTAVVLVVLAMALSGCDGANIAVKPPADKKEGSKQAVEVKPEKIKTTKIVVYRIPKNGDQQLIAEKVNYAKTGKTDAEAALDALVNTEPTSKSLQNLFPKGTAVKKVTVKDGVAFADFNKAFAKKGQGSYDEMMMVNAVVATLTEIPEIKKVQILVEGQKIVTISGHTDLLDPLERTKDMIKKN